MIVLAVLAPPEMVKGGASTMPYVLPPILFAAQGARCCVGSAVGHLSNSEIELIPHDKKPRLGLGGKGQAGFSVRCLLMGGGDERDSASLAYP